MKTRLERYSLPIYFVTAYAIAWGGCLVTASLKGFQTGAMGMGDIGLMFLSMLAGPSVSSVILTAYFEGKAGLGHLYTSLKNWRFRWQWGAVAVLTVPVLSTLILMLLASMVSAVYKPQITPATIGFGLVAGLLAGFFEEIGWTGFALPRLLRNYSPLASGLILGVLWAFWHIMADFWGNYGQFGPLWLPTFIVFWLMPLTAYRILMVWVYQNSRSLPLMQIMHAFYSGTLGVVGPATTVEEGLLWKGLFAVAIWIVLATVVILYGSELVRPKAHLEGRQRVRTG